MAHERTSKHTQRVNEMKKKEVKANAIEPCHIINSTVINSPFLGNNCQNYVCVCVHEHFKYCSLLIILLYSLSLESFFRVFSHLFHFKALGNVQFIARLVDERREKNTRRKSTSEHCVLFYINHQLVEKS